LSIQRRAGSRRWRDFARTTLSVAILAVATRIMMTIAVAMPGVTVTAPEMTMVTALLVAIRA
jgi:hypothetical protein